MTKIVEFQESEELKEVHKRKHYNTIVIFLEEKLKGGCLPLGKIGEDSSRNPKSILMETCRGLFCYCIFKELRCDDFETQVRF